jgi:hypothetical protein
MQGLKRTVLVQAFACASATFAMAFALPALAADPEPWPPSVPPGGSDSAAANGAPPSAEISPVPHAVVPPEPPEEAASPTPPAEHHEQASTEASTASPSSDVGVVVVNAQPPRPSGLEIGSMDGQFFLRTPRDGIVLLPAARLEIDGSSVATPDPYKSGQMISVDRLRLDLAGWLGSKVFFNLSADVAYAFSLRQTDNFVAVAPWGDRAILQVGQFDAPFTLENRTPDRYLDFYERGVAVRAFAIPQNKDQGIMVHGTNPARNFYYSAAVLNGEGPAVTGVSRHADVMARAWIAPFSFRGPAILSDVTVGGSAWTGDRTGEVFQGQATPGGYAFLTPVLWWMSGRMDSPDLRQEGRISAGALELDAPFWHRVGVRAEWIAKRQALAAFDTSRAQPVVVGGLTLSGWAGYAELWGWVFGSDRLLGRAAEPGQQLPVRYSDLRDTRARGGLMLSARVDHIDETLTSNGAGIGVGSGGGTRLTAYTLGGTYWFTRRVRFVVNYVSNRFDGRTPWLNGLGGQTEQEWLGRLALAL